MAHIHKLRRIFYKNKKGNKTYHWKCANRNCRFMVWGPVLEQLVVMDKYSECWRCGSVFVLRPNLMILDKPYCDGCFEYEYMKK